MPDQFDKIEKVLHLFAKKVIRDAQNELKRQGKNTSGNLSKSLGYVLKRTEKGISLNFTGAEYAKFVDQGVQGARSSFKAPMSPYKMGTGSASGSWQKFTASLDKWIVKKGLSGIRDEKGRFVSRKSLRFVIQRSIFLYGIKPSNFFSNPLKVASVGLAKNVALAFVKDAEEYLEGMTTKS